MHAQLPFHLNMLSEIQNSSLTFIGRLDHLEMIALFVLPSLSLSLHVGHSNARSMLLIATLFRTQAGSCWDFLGTRIVPKTTGTIYKHISSQFANARSQTNKYCVTYFFLMMSSLLIGRTLTTVHVYLFVFYREFPSSLHRYAS